MLRTAAHCVHVLTLPIENSMLARWRTFIARADNSCVSFMELALMLDARCKPLLLSLLIYHCFVIFLSLSVAYE